MAFTAAYFVVILDRYLVNVVRAAFNECQEREITQGWQFYGAWKDVKFFLSVSEGNLKIIKYKTYMSSFLVSFLIVGNKCWEFKTFFQINYQRYL